MLYSRKILKKKIVVKKIKTKIATKYFTNQATNLILCTVHPSIVFYFRPTNATPLPL